ncbi:hypothetical protein HZF02_00745 [Pseudomonas yamanorum]|nr:hypothetical protein HZF02_00745 [Pseudomonas yamanorum]
MDQYTVLKSNPTNIPVLAFNAFAPTHVLHETACCRIRIGTNLLETLTSVTVRGVNDQDLYHLVNSAFVSLRDGLDMLEEVQRRLDGQAEH